MKEKEKIILFTGHFGSGKSECAANYAIKSAKQGNKTALIDLDIVNPFFRTAEIAGELRANGIHVITPVLAGTTVSIPALPAEVLSAFHDTSYDKVIFDVGGDETGAKALGRYKPEFETISYRMMYVINTRRPLSSNEQDILTMLRMIEKSSRLTVTDLINNTNLSYETKPEILMDGQVLVEQVANTVGISIRYISGTQAVIAELDDQFAATIDRFPLVLFQQPDFFSLE
jgi:hypothetical protein